MCDVVTYTTKLAGQKDSRTSKPTISSTTPRTPRATFESDVTNLMIDDGASACITNNLKDFVSRSHHINQWIKGIARHARATHRGTVLWKIEDDTGKVHSININGTYYMAGMPNQILSPEHFAQAANDYHPQPEGMGSITNSTT